MPVYNGEKYLKDSIKSIVNQTYKLWELIIVNDCSDDETEEIIYEFLDDDRIKYYKLNNRRNIPYCINFGISKSKGDLIARMDCDDLMLKERLEIQSKFLNENKNIYLIGSQVYYIDEDSQNRGVSNKPKKHSEIVRKFPLYNPIIHPTVMYKREIMQIIGSYDETLHLVEDYDFFIRVSHRFIVENLDNVLLSQRVHSERQSTLYEKKQLRLSLQVLLSSIKNGLIPLSSIFKLWKKVLLIIIPYTILRKYRFVKAYYK
jgi:glycosyltransferase involved in cell wall biosynthesis